jgi:hypothetical protein
MPIYPFTRDAQRTIARAGETGSYIGRRKDHGRGPAGCAPRPRGPPDRRCPDVGALWKTGTGEAAGRGGSVGTVVCAAFPIAASAVATASAQRRVELAIQLAPPMRRLLLVWARSMHGAF